MAARARRGSSPGAWASTSPSSPTAALRCPAAWTGRSVDGLQTLERVELHTPEARAQLQGRVFADDRADLSVDAESTDLAATDDLLTRLRRALGNAEAQNAGFSGGGTFLGRWRGTLEVPVFEGRASGRDIGFLGVVWGRADWVGTADPETVESRSLVLRRAGAELWLDGRNELGWFGDKDALDLRVRFTSWPSADLVKAMEWNIDLKGPISGEATVLGRRSAPQGLARITSQAGRYYGVPFEEAVVTTRWAGHVAEVTTGRVRVGGGTVTLRGSLTDDGVYDGAAEAAAVDVGALVALPIPDVALAGRISGSLTLQGTLSRPRLSCRLTSPRLFVADEGIGALEARLTGTGDGRVQLDARLRSPRLDLVLTGGVGAASPHEAVLRIAAKDTSLDPYLRVAFPALPGALGLVATGEVALRGPLDEARALTAEVTVSDLRLVIPDYPLRNGEPLRRDPVERKAATDHAAPLGRGHRPRGRRPDGRGGRRSAGDERARDGRPAGALRLEPAAAWPRSGPARPGRRRDARSPPPRRHPRLRGSGGSPARLPPRRRGRAGPGALRREDRGARGDHRDHRRGSRRDRRAGFVRRRPPDLLRHPAVGPWHEPALPRRAPEPGRRRPAPLRRREGAVDHRLDRREASDLEPPLRRRLRSCSRRAGPSPPPPPSKKGCASTSRCARRAPSASTTTWPPCRRGPT